MSANEEHNRSIMRQANAGSPNKTRAATKEYKEGWDRIFKKNKFNAKKEKR